MRNKYHITDDGYETVSISLKKPSNDSKDYLDSFLDIWVDEADLRESPFKNIEDARLFAMMILKLLVQVT